MNDNMKWLLVLSVAFLSACTDAYDDPLASRTSVYSMRVGACLTDRQEDQGDEVGDVAQIPCDRPHRQEVYHVENVDFPAWPGDEAMDARADEICDARFEAYVGLPYDESEFLFTYLRPGKGSWAEEADREVVCLVALPEDAEWTGLAKGTRR